MANGKLVVNAKKQVRVRFTNSKSKEVELPVPDAELAPRIRKELAGLQGRDIDKINGRDVELDEEKGQPKQVRPVGEPFATTAPPPSAPISLVPPNFALSSTSNSDATDFINPYNFLPATRRDAVTGPLGDSAPVGHDRLHANCFTGVIRVCLTTETPLLIPDAAKSEDDARKHKSFPVRIGPDDKPFLAPTSIKGMLRSAYEAVTNSRFGVFPGVLPETGRGSSGHGARLAMRMPAGDGLAMIPARVFDATITLLMGTTVGFPARNTHTGRWEVPGSLQYAAWLARYLGAPRIYADTGKLPEHGDLAHCWIQKIQHWRLDRKRNRYVTDFQFWGVMEIVRDRSRLRAAPGGADPAPTVPGPNDRPPKSYYQRLSEVMQIEGWVSISNENIKGKHDERVFFGNGPQAVDKPVTESLLTAWFELVRNYQSEHSKDLEQREKDQQKPWDYLGHVPGKTAWSRHVYTEGAERLESTPTLCYAFVDRASGEVQGLYPVMISRKLYDRSPLESLDFSLRPATLSSQLSPADRVFGWVNQGGKGAHRGQVRVGPVSCESEDAIQTFSDDALPLAILGQPKPQQVRFYLGDAHGSAQSDGQTKEEAGYDGHKQIRGRKVYPHHARLATDHWVPSSDGALTTSDPTVFREYLRPNLVKDSQNRSIRGWVKPKTKFAFDMHVVNLSMVELGALVWLLTLPENHFHRLGLGKPLGFGSIRLDINDSRVVDTEGWKQIYRTLDDAEIAAVKLSVARTAFEDEMRKAYPRESEQLLKSFLTAAKGFPAYPVHYPRVGQIGTAVPPNPDGAGFKWFVDNDNGDRVALPTLTNNDPGLSNAPRQS